MAGGGDPEAQWRQGLTLVNFSARRKRFLWDRVYMQGLSRGSSGDVSAYCGLFRVQ